MNNYNILTCSRSFLASLAIAASLGLAGPAAAEDGKTLKFSHVFSNTHWLWTDSFKDFEARVAERTGGKIDFVNFHAGQLGKELSSIMKSGMADMGIFVPSYEPSKLPLSSVAELPSLYSSSCEGTQKLWELAKEGGVLDKKEYEPLGVKILYVHVLHPYKLMTGKEQVATLEDVNGLKIRGNGSSMSKVVRALGGVPVQTTTSEVYDALSRGTVDGAMWPIGSTRESSLDGILQYSVEGPGFGSGAVLFGITTKAWKQLSPETQEVMQSTALEVQQELCESRDKDTVRMTQWLVAERGLKVVELSEQEVARWDSRLALIPQEWAEEMDSSGRSGSEMLKAFREAG